MAKKEKPQAAPTGTAGKKGGVMGFIVLMIAFGVAVPFILPSLVLLAGMLPTVVALFTDTDRRKSSVITIGSMNAAGIAPFVIELWQKGQTMDNAVALIEEPNTWLVILGAAAMGQLILTVVPQIIASLTFARAEARMKILKENMEKLRAAWGPDVATAKPLAKIVRGE